MKARLMYAIFIILMLFAACSSNRPGYNNNNTGGYGNDRDSYNYRNDSNMRMDSSGGRY